MAKLTSEQQQQLNRFFAQVERRAFKMTMIATHNVEDALDIVQDAMYKLVNKYAHKPAQEWGGLFHRILQNRIMDHHRRTQIRNKLFFWQQHEQQENDASLVNDLYHAEQPSTEQQASNWQLGQQAVKILESLPIRQQQAFLLRAWEGYDTSETAKNHVLFTRQCKNALFKSQGKTKTGS